MLNIKQFQVAGHHGVHGADALTQLAVTIPLLVSVIEQEPVREDLECLMIAREITLNQEIALQQQVATCICIVVIVLAILVDNQLIGYP